MPPNAASTLMIEDELKKVVLGDRSFKHREKQSGIIPRGMDSPFGDFPTMTGQDSNHECRFVLVRPRKLRMDGGGLPPPTTGIFKRATISPTDFRRFYSRGDLPVQIQHGTSNRIDWKLELQSIDYNHYLPLFLEGLREKEDPYRFLSVQGTYDLLDTISVEALVASIPQLIVPIKKALDTRDAEVIATVCKVIQAVVLVRGGSIAVGQALVPYFRQLLPTMNIFKSSNRNLLDKFDYTQRKRLCLGDLIEETLQLLERYGGSDAFINIKYMVPTYESVVA